MGNSVRGVFDIESDGKTYTLHFSTNALCALEEKTGESFMSFAKNMENGDVSMSAMRQFLWAGLIDHQEGITLEDVGVFMDGLGGMEGVAEVLSKAFGAALPDPDQDGSAPAGKKKAAA